MTFALVNITCKERHQVTCVDKGALAIDILVISAAVTLIFLMVIGKINVGVPGELGTVSNQWIQAMMGGSIGIFVLDVIIGVIKCKAAYKQHTSELEEQRKKEEESQFLKDVQDPKRAEQALAAIQANPQLSTLVLPDGNTVVHLAMRHEEQFGLIKEIYDCCIRNQVKINFAATNRLGQTPFHIAVQSQNVKVICWLNGVYRLWYKDKQAIVDQEDNEGNTALHYACQAFASNNGKMEMIELLVFSCKVTKEITNKKSGKKPIDLVPEVERENIEKLFKDKPRFPL